MSDNEKRIKELEKEIEYEKRKMNCCGYGRRELVYLSELEEELENLMEQEDI